MGSVFTQLSAPMMSATLNQLLEVFAGKSAILIITNVVELTFYRPNILRFYYFPGYGRCIKFNGGCANGNNFATLAMLSAVSHTIMSQMCIYVKLIPHWRKLFVCVLQSYPMPKCQRIFNRR